METNQRLEQVYRDCFPAVARMLRSLGCEEDEAKDIFHDALILYLERLQGKEQPVKSEAAYITGVARHLWYRRFRNSIITVPLEDQHGEEFEGLADAFEKEEERYQGLLQKLMHVGTKCLQLLQAFYYEGLKMQEVAERFRYGSVRSATVQKYKCIEKLRNEVKTLKYEKAA